MTKKTHVCLYCSKLDQKNKQAFAKTKITDENDTNALIKLQPKSKERKMLGDFVRMKGKFYHNVRLLKADYKDIVVKRKCIESKNPGRELPTLQILLGFFSHI